MDHLPQDDLDALTPELETVALETRQIVAQPREPVDRVYFPQSGVISLLTVAEEGGSVEVTTIGNEGMVGVATFLGATLSTTQAITQVAGTSLAMDTDRFLAVARESTALQQTLLRYAASLLAELSQNAACNRLHTNEERLARWLLLSHDRVGSDEFPMTQEFLGQMLGVRRATVTIAAGVLQQAGFIRYRWGKITIADRAGLEGAACECYRVTRAEDERLLGGT